MTGLKSLTLVAKDAGTDPILARRGNFVTQLLHQRALAQDPSHAREVWVTRPAEGGGQERVPIKKPVRRWWTVDASGRVLFKLRYGRKSVEVEKGKPNVAVGAIEDLPSTIDVLIEAVKNGELDDALTALAQPRPKRGTKMPPRSNK